MTPDPLFAVKGKVVVLTGACGLIGRTAARAFADRGARLVAADLAEADPAALAADLGDDAMGVAADVADAGSVAALVAAARERFGRIDVLVNNHQADPPGFDDARPETFPEELWDAIVDVNLKGTFLTCREVGAVMLAQGGGSIINMASTYAVVSSNPALYEDNSVGNPLAYSAAKGGVIALTRYLGVHWAAQGVRVNCVTPHGVWNHHEQAFERRFSEMSPMGRMMTADEVVGALLFLASDAGAYATASNLLVEGGWTAW